MRSTETYTPSLHDALPICRRAWQSSDQWWRSLTTAEKESFGQEQKQIQADYAAAYEESLQPGDERVRAVTTRLHRWLSGDRKSTRLNSSHVAISYAVFCLK